jgi:hypothetical protein
MRGADGQDDRHGVGSGQVWFAESEPGPDAAVKVIAVNQNAGA